MRGTLERKSSSIFRFETGVVTDSLCRLYVVYTATLCRTSISLGSWRDAGDKLSTDEAVAEKRDGLCTYTISSKHINAASTRKLSWLFLRVKFSGGFVCEWNIYSQLFAPSASFFSSYNHNACYFDATTFPTF
jgi:hypothetical protein